MTDWTTPKTWQPGEGLTPDALNEQIRDNLLYLAERPRSIRVARLEEVSNYSTASTTLIPLDDTLFKLTIKPTGGDLRFLFSCMARQSSTGNIQINIFKDDTEYIEPSGISFRHLNTQGWGVVAFSFLYENTSSEEMTFSLHWRAGSNTVTIYAIEAYILFGVYET